MTITDAKIRRVRLRGELIRLLDELAPLEPSQIAEKLSADGLLTCEGRPYRVEFATVDTGQVAYNCPIANYLLHHLHHLDPDLLKDASLAVGGFDVDVEFRGLQFDGVPFQFDGVPSYVVVSFPENVTTFIGSFDLGLYEELRNDQP